MDTKESVQERFGAVAPRYASSWPHATGPDLDALIDAAQLAGGEVALDVGCGAGHTAFALAGVAARVVALDLTQAMLDETRAGASQRELPHLEAREGDAEDLPFDDESFDVVTSRLAAHHFPHAARFVEEAYRVLRPGGRFVLSDTISPADDAQDTYGNALEVLRDPSHVRNHRARDWLRMFEEAGFAAGEERGRFACPLDFEVWTARMDTPPPAREGLQALFRAAPEGVARAFCIDPDGRSWQLEIAVLSARKP